MTDRDEYVEKLKAQLDQWNAQLATCESAAREAMQDAFGRARFHFKDL